MNKPLPAQVEQMIGRMMDKKERSDVRHNYMNSLLDIRDEIDRQVAKFKRETGLKYKEKA
jgi:hypothetical protein